LPAEKKITLDQLARAQGAAGQPIYIAYQGRVYDVSASGRWEGGEHMGLYQAGHDLPGEFADAPHGEEVFERSPQVGVLANTQEVARRQEAEVEAVPPPAVPEALARWLHRFPILKRHPHPMLVHFPLAFMIATTLSTGIYVARGVRSFEATGWHCLGGGVLFIPAAMLTGLLTWWLNYQARWLRPVVMKMILSPILLLLAVGLFVWRLLNPGILDRLAGLSILYFALILLLTPLVIAIGWYGASLTFPLHEDQE
jgi:predicted heme/steroid binding protein/uncharacterized membrane protein